MRTINGDAVDAHRPRGAVIVRGEAPETADADGADDADVEIPTHSVPEGKGVPGWEETI